MVKTVSQTLSNNKTVIKRSKAVVDARMAPRARPLFVLTGKMVKKMVHILSFGGIRDSNIAPGVACDASNNLLAWLVRLDAHAGSNDVPARRCRWTSEAFWVRTLCGICSICCARQET